MSTTLRCATTLALGVLAACSPGDGTAYTLYGDLPASRPGVRVHVATFDAKEREGYNLENCQTAARLFQTQRRDTGRFWCEKGRFRR